MKKSRLRMISAALAVCMMTSVLPMGAMAQGGGQGSRKRRKRAGADCCTTEGWRCDHRCWHVHNERPVYPTHQN